MRVGDALQTLGLPSSATPAEIKAAYRRLVKAWHPDRHGSDEERRARAEEAFKRINEAYECLRHGASVTDSGSMFSVRPPTRAASRPRRRYSQRKTARWRRRTLGDSAAWITLIVAIVVLASSGVWFLTRNTVSVKEPAGSRITIGRVGVTARRVGTDWSVQNPTRQVWSQCRAWVGPKSLIIPKFDPGSTLSLPAKAFEPPLVALDDDKTLELFCVSD